MFDHVKHVASWTTMTCHVYDPMPIIKWWLLQFVTCTLKTFKLKKPCGQSLMKWCWSMGFHNLILSDSWLIMHKPIGTLSKLFMVLGTPLLGWLIRSAYVYSIGFNRLIGTLNNWSNLSYKINTMFFATSTRMQCPLWKLTISMLQFVVGGCHQGLLLK
jgi:hypothetical protein